MHTFHYNLLYICSIFLIGASTHAMDHAPAPYQDRPQPTNNIKIQHRNAKRKDVLEVTNPIAARRKLFRDEQPEKKEDIKN